MNERNKLSLEQFAKNFGLIIWLMLVIIACAGNWNYCPEGFVKVCSGLLMAVNLGAIVYLFLKWRKEYNDAIEALQKQDRAGKVAAANKKK